MYLPKSACTSVRTTPHEKHIWTFHTHPRGHFLFFFLGYTNTTKMSEPIEPSGAGLEQRGANPGEQSSEPWPPSLSDDYLERMARESNTCERCRIACGPKKDWTRTTPRPGSRSKFIHHQSYESLLNSVSMGCPICISVLRAASSQFSTIACTYVSLFHSEETYIVLYVEGRDTSSHGSPLTWSCYLDEGILSFFF